MSFRVVRYATLSKVPNKCVDPFDFVAEHSFLGLKGCFHGQELAVLPFYLNSLGAQAVVLRHQF